MADLVWFDAGFARRLQVKLPIQAVSPFGRLFHLRGPGGKKICAIKLVYEMLPNEPGLECGGSRSHLLTLFQPHGGRYARGLVQRRFP
jgi:hypothetical protein